MRNGKPFLKMNTYTSSSPFAALHKSMMMMDMNVVKYHFTFFMNSKQETLQKVLNNQTELLKNHKTLFS